MGQLVFPLTEDQSEFEVVTAGASRLRWGVMGTLSERPADAVVCGSRSADKIFDVPRLSCGALRFAHTDRVIRESLMVSPATGAEHFRDGAILATSL
jgi:hypothetical protein